jgi:hypothetical protein
MNHGKDSVPEQLSLWAKPVREPLQKPKPHAPDVLPLGSVRFCAKCSRDLSVEPAVKEAEALLCFPCRVATDNGMNESRLIHSEWYRKELVRYQEELERQELEHRRNLAQFEKETAEWKANYAHRQLQWQKLERYLDAGWALGGGGVLVLALIYGFFRAGLWVEFIGPYLFWGCLAVLAGSAIAWLLGPPSAPVCPSPPSLPLKPQEDTSWRFQNLVLLFDGNPFADGDSQFLDWPDYPPDWDKRKCRCLERDQRRCRICGSVDQPHVHHVIPIYSSGNHSMQNLITVCDRCHGRCHTHLARLTVQRIVL